MGEKPTRHVCLIPGGRGDDDPWTPNWDQWTIPARDTQGHYVREQIKMPPQLSAEARKLVASGLTPYKSIGYLYRNSVLQHLLDLRHNPAWCNAEGSVIHAVNAMIKAIRDDEYMEDFRMIFDKLMERVRDHEGRDRTDKAKQLIIQMWDDIIKIEDPYWREEYEGELRRRFGRYLKKEELG
jgi:hypothetical protein